MYEEQFCSRLAQLRIEKGVSARDMSLSLGQSESYINRIETGRMLPSLTVFFYICDYFQISPSDFFQFEIRPGIDTLSAVQKLQNLPPKKREHIIAIIEDLS